MTDDRNCRESHGIDANLRVNEDLIDVEVDALVAAEHVNKTNLKRDARGCRLMSRGDYTLTNLSGIEDVKHDRGAAGAFFEDRSAAVVDNIAEAVTASALRSEIFISARCNFLGCDQ